MSREDLISLVLGTIPVITFALGYFLCYAVERAFIRRAK